MTVSATSLVVRLDGLIGSEHVLTGVAEGENYAVDGLAPSVIARPISAEQAAEVVRFAAAEKLSVVPVGARTKLGMGMPPHRFDIALDLTRLDQVAHYDPGDLTLSVDAGMPLARLAQTLAEHKQFLPLAVPWFDHATVGGTIAAGVDSPLRQFYGTARDFVLGAEFVNGSGALVKSGGRVVKNVTGYDLHKLLIGSLGTLAAITRVNFRTFPSPPASRGFVASFEKRGDALALRRRIAESPLTPVTLEILSPATARIFTNRSPSSLKRPIAPPGPWFQANEWQVCAGFEGTPEVIARYARDLTRLAEESGASSANILDDATRPLIWARLRESIPLLLDASPGAAIAKLSLLPGNWPAAFEELHEISLRFALPFALIARGTGSVYCAFLPDAVGQDSMSRLAEATTAVFESAARAGGHAAMPWCPTELKSHFNIWGPPRADWPLMQRVKSAFDPAGIFSPGRFAGGI